MPSPVEAFPWGSMSITRVGSPTAARAVPRLMAVVVLPTPPFWLATTRMRGGLSAVSTAQLPDIEDHARGVRAACMLLDPHIPDFARVGQFGPYGLALEEQIPRISTLKKGRIGKQLRQRCTGPCGDQVERLRFRGLDSGASDLYLHPDPARHLFQEAAFLEDR